MAIYRTYGTLTHAIPADGIHLAQAYLQEDDMTQYIDAPLRDAVTRVQWHLANDGHDYYIEAITERELTDDELKELAEWTSGQNSDGLGESFEQQEFAWVEDGEDEVDCDNCSGTGEVNDEECISCDGAGYFPASDEGRMCSFDWQKNDSKYERVA